jgi:hypothetical protein
MEIKRNEMWENESNKGWKYVKEWSWNGLNGYKNVLYMFCIDDLKCNAWVEIGVYELVFD